MHEEKTIREYDRLIVSTVSKHARFIDRTRTSNTFEDLVQEGRIAALKAIRTYDDNKSAQLKTYIVNCIRNRIYDLYRASTRQRIPQHEYKDDPTYYEGESVDQTSGSDIRMDLEAYLDSNEFKIVEDILNNCADARDLTDKMHDRRAGDVECKYERRHIRRECRNEVVACLSRVQQLLKLEDHNRPLKVLKQQVE